MTGLSFLKYFFLTLLPLKCLGSDKNKKLLYIFKNMCKKIKKLQTVLLLSKVATGVVLWEKVFLKISQISQESTCVGVSC